RRPAHRADAQTFSWMAGGSEAHDSNCHASDYFTPVLPCKNPNQGPCSGGNARLGGLKTTRQLGQPLGLTRAVQAPVREHHLSGATTAPRIPALSIAALTSPPDLASSMNWRAYATPGSRPFGIAIACGSTPGRPSRTREPGS